MGLNTSITLANLDQLCRNSEILGEMKKDEQIWAFGNSWHKTCAANSFSIRSENRIVVIVNKIIETVLKIFFFIGRLATWQNDEKNLKKIEDFVEELKDTFENVPLAEMRDEIQEKLLQTKKNLTQAVDFGLKNYKETCLEGNSELIRPSREERNSRGKRVQDIIDKLKSQVFPLLDEKNVSHPITVQTEELFPFTPPAKTPDIAFGKEKWIKHFGDIGTEPPLPKNIEELLLKPCPIFPGKTIGESHVLVLIPRVVNNQPLTVARLLELVKTPKGNGFATHPYIVHFVADVIASKQIVEKSCWVLMPKDVIPSSKAKSFKELKAMLAALSDATGLKYEYPTAAQVIACVLLEYVRCGIAPFSGGDEKEPDTWSFTLCKEHVKKDWRVVVGGFTQGNLVIDHGIENNSNMGVAPILKL